MKMILGIFLIFGSLTSFAQDNCEMDNRLLKRGNFEEHYLDFVNFAYRFQGRCRGHSVVMQKSFYLMEFNKGENPNNCSVENFPFECQKVYYDKFAKIFFENQVQEIPGFKNLAEFSSIPYINSLLKYHVSRTPTTFKTLIAHNRFLNSEENPSIAHFKEAVERVQEYQIPYLAISSYWTGDHAVLGYRFKKVDDVLRLCVRDPNLIPNMSIECENYFYLGKLETRIPNIDPAQPDEVKITDEVYYHKRGESIDQHLLTVRIYEEEDERTQEYIQARYQYCLDSKI